MKNLEKNVKVEKLENVEAAEHYMCFFAGVGLVGAVATIVTLT